MSRCLFVLLVCSSWRAAGAPAPPDLQKGTDLARSIRDAGFDPEECYRVRDLSFQKEDIRLYFTDGYLIFSKPVAGEPRSALFTAEVEGGDGEVILLPPNRGERQSLAVFTQSANLDEHFRDALMIFTDGSGRVLRDRIEKEGTGRKAGEMGALLAGKWTPVLGNIAAGFTMRLVADLLAPPRSPGMFFLALSGRQLGNFDIFYDPYSREQILAGQLAEHGGNTAYNIWTSFAERSSRNGAGTGSAREPWFTLANFRIDAALAADLRMKATTRVTARIGARPLQALPLNISHAMKVTSARIDGAPAELFFQDSIREHALKGGDSDAFLLLPGEALAAQSEHEIEFEHEGAVIVPAGSGVYYVGSRATWYPGSGGFATYDLTFRYPKRLTLVSAGDLAADRVDGDWRVTRWRTPAPIRMAGFNLGEYEKVSGSAAGYTVEVYGNRHLETALERPEPDTVLPQVTPRRSVRRLTTPDPVVPELHIAPDPRARLRGVAANVSSSLEFFSAKFGPAALKTLTVAPIPGTMGQGFPGLVYLSTLSYLDPRELLQAPRVQQRQLLFSDLMESHEVAHQWWGNVVSADSPQDVWLLEALSNYSALLWMEKTRGIKVVETILDDYRDHLLAKDLGGRAVESAGPVVWGDRLDATGVADAWRVITYEKGAWILHMLRRRMGDEQFFKMLAELRRRYEFRTISTRDFQALVKEFRPADAKGDALDDFFDNWVYATGIPALKLQYSVKGVAPAVKVSGTLTQSGVEDDFSVEVPIEIQFAKGAPRTIWVTASNEAAPFSVTLRQLPARVAVPAGFLAVKK